MSNDSKFRAIPKPVDFTIPFKLEEKELLNWLIDLTHYESKEACTKILSLLQALNKLELPFKQRIIFLKQINEYLKQYIHCLEGPCWDASFPLSIEENVYAEMAVWNYSLLGEGFFIAADSANKKEDAVFSLAMALQCLGQAQLHIAAVYSEPSEGFWRLIYQIFFWAEKKKLQHVTLERSECNGLTINTLFARSIIFQVCDTNQFHSRDMRTIFNFLSKVCINVAIEIYSDKQDELFMLDLKSDNPPYNVKAQTELGSDLVRYFSPVIVADAIDNIIKQGETWSGALKSINNTLFSRVAKTLGLKQQRQYHRKSEGHSLLGVIGFEDIIGFLHKTSKNNLVDPQQLIQKADPDSENLGIYDDTTDKDGRSITGAADDYQLKHQLAANNQPIWEQTKTVSEVPIKKVSLKEIKVCDSSANGYSVSWNQISAKAKIGDLFGIVSEDKKRLEIAIIRRIALNTGNDFRGDFRFGAELLGFESEIVYLRSVENPSIGAWAVLIPGIELLERPNSLIYNIGQFKTGENIHLHRGNKVILCLLVKELHATTAVSHVEADFIKEC